MKAGMTKNKIKKVHGYFQLHLYEQRMQPAVTSSYSLEGGFAYYCKMFAVTLILCANWALYLSPLSKIEQ